MVQVKSLFCLVLLTTNFRWIALHFAAQNGHLSTIQWLVTQSPNTIQTATKKTGNSILVKNYLTSYLHIDSLKKYTIPCFYKSLHCSYNYLQLKNYNHIQLLSFERKSKHSLLILVNKISVFNIISQKHFQTHTQFY